MHCAYCSEKITGKVVKHSGGLFCSLECANRAAGVDTEEENEYYEETPLDYLEEE